MKQNNSFSSLISGSTKIAGPVSGLIGTLADVFSPLAPFAPIILVISLITFFYMYFLKVRPALSSESSEIVFSGMPAQVAGFSLISAVVMLLFWGISSNFSEEGGVVAANFDGVKSFQESIGIKLDKISEKQDEIASDVKDIKEIVTGEAEIKQLSNTQDYSVFEDVNKSTTLENRKTIAVLYFDNSGNNADLNPLRKGLADMLISDLSNLKMLRVVERDKLEEILSEINLSNSKGFDASTQQKIGKLLGAETILFGSYFDMMGQFRIDARIVKTETGEIVKSEGVNGKTEDFMKLEKQLVWKIARGLDIRFTEKEKNEIMKTEDVNYSATIAYSKGLELFDGGDNDKALEQFQKALKLDSKFTQAQSMIEKINGI